MARFILGFVLVIALFYAIAPKPVTGIHTTDPSQFQAACAQDGGPVRAVLSDSVGSLYRVWCRDGVNLLAAQ